MAFQTQTRGNQSLTAGVTWADNAEVEIAGGDQIIDQNVDQSAFDIRKFVVSQPFKGQVGKSGSPVRFNVNGNPTVASSYLHYLAQAGAMYYGGATSDTVFNLVVDSERGTFHALQGTYTRVAVVNGTLMAGASSAITTLQMWGGVAELDYNATSVDATLFDRSGRLVQLTTRRDGVYRLNGRAKLIVDHRNSSPSIETHQDSELTFVSVINGDIDDVHRNAGDMSTLEAETAVSIGANTHRVGPQGLSGLYYNQGRDTVATPEYLAAVNAGSPQQGVVA